MLDYDQVVREALALHKRYNVNKTAKRRYRLIRDLISKQNIK